MVVSYARATGLLHFQYALIGFLLRHRAVHMGSSITNGAPLSTMVVVSRFTPDLGIV